MAARPSRGPRLLDPPASCPPRLAQTRQWRPTALRAEMLGEGGEDRPRAPSPTGPLADVAASADEGTSTILEKGLASLPVPLIA